jgi:hypothetical protein|tara:strand:- start:1344 stop:2048 length:705 start_codon:yes stop_codon:yes gene_type:complete
MPLPKLAIPEYELELPLTGTKVTYRPFLVKEEKLLYLAMESQDNKQMVKAVKTIIKNCTNLKGNVDNLATFEIEYIFLRIRAVAVGEISEFKITAPDDDETSVAVKVPLQEVDVQVPDGHDKKIQLDDKIGIVMKYPSLDAFIQQNMSENPTVDDIFEMAAKCIDQVYDEEEVYDSFSHKEALEFLENLNSEQFALIQNFFETMPKLSHTIEVYNPKTKVKSEVVLEGLASFFE